MLLNQKLAPASIILHIEKMGLEIVLLSRIFTRSRLGDSPPSVAMGTFAVPSSGISRRWASLRTGPSSGSSLHAPAKDGGAQCPSLAESSVTCTLRPELLIAQLP